MKCQSIAAIWSRAPPIHQITSTAVINNPATLYTGGSDGSIIWWNLSSNQFNQEIWPMAMLCGHAAPIADLDICVPTTVDAQGGESTSVGCGSLISACTDGVLCIWSRSSGHCRRRRKMPLWVGSPSSVSTLPTSPRYVCIACCSFDSTHSSNHPTMEHVESSDSMADRETQHGRPSTKYAVVIVDSYSLNIVRTVFHGALSIGLLNFMSIVPSGKYMEVSSIVLADVHGKMQSIILLEESDQERGTGTNLHESASHNMICSLNDGLRDEDNIVSLATHGKLLVLVYRSHCVFRLVDSGVVIGEMSLLDGPLCDDNLTSQSSVVGGMFLFHDSDGKVLDDEDQTTEFVKSFVVWNDQGAGLVYKISGSDDTCRFELSCEIPAVCLALPSKLSISFCQMNDYILRIESMSPTIEESLFWKPHISIWSMSPESDVHGKLNLLCKMLGGGGFPGDLNEVPGSLSINELGKANIFVTPTSEEIRETSQQEPLPIQTIENGSCAAEKNLDLVQKEHIVSSSMVIYDHLNAPYSIVYGFYSGEIKVVRFEVSYVELNSPISPLHEQCFLGHTGPILCLAAHSMPEISNQRSFSRILVSGSMDCTVCIWNLDTSELITVMHHHIAPVRQIILPPPRTGRPWNDCFLSVGDDYCVALASFETLRVERMFPGHANYPSSVVWDGARGYIACLCRNHVGVSDAADVLSIWDVKTGTRERVLRGPASHSMFDHFCKGINLNSATDSVLGGITSASSLHLPITEDTSTHSQSKQMETGAASSNFSQRQVTTLTSSSITNASEGKSGGQHSKQLQQDHTYPVKCSCPFPGIATLRFDLSSLMFPRQNAKQFLENCVKQESNLSSERGPEKTDSFIASSNDVPSAEGSNGDLIEEHEWFKIFEGCIMRFSLSFLHLWGVDLELDRLMVSEMNINNPNCSTVASGLQGDRGSATLAFPSPRATLELWRSSSEFCAIRTLTMVAIAQRMVSLSLSSPGASSSLAAFYIRNFAEKFPDIKPPSLQLLVSFWQDDSEHVRLAARSLFHCAASRAVPHPLSGPRVDQVVTLQADEKHNMDTSEKSASILVDPAKNTEIESESQLNESGILSWLESFEMQDWVSCVGGTIQDAMASHIIVAAALAIWYPSLVKTSLPELVVHPLIKLLMTMNEKYSPSAAELLAEGMDNVWKACIGPEIPRLLADIFFQVECVSTASAKSSEQNTVTASAIRDSLVAILLPSLAMADIPGFLHVIESQIWSTASDSPVHLVSLLTLIRVVRGSPKPLAQYLDKVIDFILLTIDHTNSVMRKACLPSSMAALKEVVRAFPMISLNDSSTRLAVGDAIGEIHNVTIRVYDMQSVTKIKVLDASGPPGLPNLLKGTSEKRITTAISALSFTPDGEGLVAFSEHGLMIRWWSLGSGWWEKLSRNLVPVQCTKLIFVPEWEGFSPNYSRASIMDSVLGHDRRSTSEEKLKSSSELESPRRLLLYNLDLSYRLEWVGDRKVQLTRFGNDLGTFQL
ncbi:hypothetical protein ACHQM5_011544 [Ranunculus cassubicifolius]